MTGANSSGKSSILYAILGAIQSNEFPLQFSPNGKYVNMGDYKQMVFRNDETKNIRIDLRFEDYFYKEPITVTIPYSTLRGVLKPNTLPASFAKK